MNANQYFRCCTRRVESCHPSCYSAASDYVDGRNAMTSTFEQELGAVIAALEAGEGETAVAAARRCIELEPKNPEGHFCLGEALATVEKPEEAIKAYELGLKLEPEDTDALTALGDLYFELGRHKEALQTYRKIVDLNPKDADGYVNIGLVYNAMERAE